MSVLSGRVSSEGGEEVVYLIGIEIGIEFETWTEIETETRNAFSWAFCDVLLCWAES